jgi:hypothetical protein
MSLTSPWHGHLARSLFLAACFTLPATAQLDTNANGMSDVWERQFNQRALFPTNQTPEADPDGDGWTNLQESIAGTNPFSGNPPIGMVETLVTHLKDQEEIPTGRLIDLAIISWETLPGKSYTLHYSPSLAHGSWIPVDGARYGDGAPAAVAITLTDSAGIEPEKLFWRVEIENQDSDSDDLTDHEETILGTNPYAAQTQPGIDDFWMAVNHPTTLPNGMLADLDADGDGLTLAQELLLNLNPQSPDNPGIQQDAIVNGDFSNPTIGSGERAGASWMTWDFWPNGGVPGWSAVEGENIEFQTITPVATGDPYLELKAHPSGHWGVRQQIGTRKNAAYLLVFQCKPRDGIAPEQSNFHVKIDGSTVLEVNFAAPAAWEQRGIAFTAKEAITELELVPVNLVDATQGALIDKIELIPYTVKDNIVATGVDAISRTVSPQDAGYQPDYWIMAPQQGSTFVNENLTHFRFKSSSIATGTISSANATAAPPTISLNGNDQNMTWRGGNGTGINDEARLEIQFSNQGTKYPLQVQTKSMKNRTVRVKVHYITGGMPKYDLATGEQQFNPDGTPVWYRTIAPPTILSAASIKSKLDEIFGRQINAWFEVDSSTATLFWDRARSEDWSTETHPIIDNIVNPENGSFDIGSPADDINKVLPEESAILDLKDENYDINVFVIGGARMIQKYTNPAAGEPGVPSNLMFFNEGITLGLAPSVRGPVVYLTAGRFSEVGHPPELLLNMMVHEIGHVMIGGGHPDQGGGAAPLAGSNHMERLMFSDIDAKIAANAHDVNLLVKKEWDAAEVNLEGLLNAEEEE